MTDDFQDRAVQDDDVIAAYRWVLGRDPEDAAKIPSQVAANDRVRDLRLGFLRSPEFSRTLDRLAIVSSNVQEQVSANPEVTNSARLLFVHIPKTAGSSLFHAFEAALPDSSLCPIRQNTLLTRPVIELGRYSAFFGHYDVRMTRLLPGKPCLLTMLREPRARLVSLYRYLRAHTAERARVESLELARVARSVGFREFLLKARALAPASVDNTYVRTFGGALPLRRWEDTSEPNWRKNQPSDPLTQLPEAEQALDQFDAIGTVESFDESLAAFNDVLDLRFGTTLSVPPRVQVTDSLADVSPGFEAVAHEGALQDEIDSAADLLDELTVGDRVLYDVGCKRLKEAANS